MPQLCKALSLATVKDEAHDGHKHGQGRPAAGEHLVYLAAALVLLALLGFHHGAGTHLVDEVVAHVGHGCCRVETALCLELLEDVVEQLLLVVAQFQCFDHDMVALYHLAGSKAHGYVGCLGVVLDEVHHGMDAAVHGATVVVGAAKVLASGRLLVLGHVQGVIDELVDALVFHCRDGHHRQAQLSLHGVDAYRAPVVAHLVHHVQCQHHGHVELHELHGEIQVALDVGGIDDVDDALGCPLMGPLFWSTVTPGKLPTC